MKIVLVQDVSGLGKKGQLKNVKEGYARNYLLPKALAVMPGEKEAQKMVADKLLQKEKNILHEKEIEKLFLKLNNKKFTFSARARNNGQLYGSIGPRELSQKLNLPQNLITNHYKQIGSYPLELSLGNKKCKVEIEIIKET